MMIQLLLAAFVYTDGFLSGIEPTGYLKEFCARQKSGLTGHPEAMSYPYDSCLWAGEIKRMGEHGDGWWRYEQTAYYSDGLLKLGYLLKDPALIAKGEAGVRHVLDGIPSDGLLGPHFLWEREMRTNQSGLFMWPLAVYFRVLRSYYEMTRDPRVPKALERCFLSCTPAELAAYRNLVNVEGLVWTYFITRNPALLKLAEDAWNYPGRAEMMNWNDDPISIENCLNDDPLYVHGVTYCELMKIPVILAAATGKREYFDQAGHLEMKLVRDHMLPDGCPSSVEQTRGKNAYWGHETCVISDFTWSMGYALQATGDARYADAIERCVFNAGLGCVTKDFKTLQYFSNINQFIACGDSNQNPFFYGSTWQQYRPTHQTECCAGNVHRFMPNYISRMWMQDEAGNPVAALYGPSVFRYSPEVTIREETDYPFEGTIRFVIDAKKTTTFAFTYRVPNWCCAGAEVSVNGEKLAEAAKAGTFGTIRRAFRSGDVIELRFPMAVRFDELPASPYIIKDAATRKTLVLEGPQRSQGVVVSRGPLLFSYPIDAQVEVDDRIYANMNGKQSANPDFVSLSMRPQGRFNFALASTNVAKVVRTGAAGYPYDLKSVPVAIEVEAREIDWALKENRFTPELPRVVSPRAEKNETIRLVPYGATCLRLTAFPFTIL